MRTPLGGINPVVSPTFNRELLTAIQLAVMQQLGANPIMGMAQQGYTASFPYGGVGQTNTLGVTTTVADSYMPGVSSASTLTARATSAQAQADNPYFTSKIMDLLSSTREFAQNIRQEAASGATGGQVPSQYQQPYQASYQPPYEPMGYRVAAPTGFYQQGIGVYR
jgi:hypothetical protein